MLGSSRDTSERLGLCLEDTGGLQIVKDELAQDVDVARSALGGSFAQGRGRCCAHAHLRGSRRTSRAGLPPPRFAQPEAWLRRLRSAESPPRGSMKGATRFLRAASRA